MNKTTNLIIIPIAITIAIIIALSILHLINKFRKIKEHYRSYEDIQKERHNLCPVYADSFFGAYINTKEEVRKPFLEWCNDFKKTQRHYPEYRAAERVFLRFNHIYGRHLDT